MKTAICAVAAILILPLILSAQTIGPGLNVTVPFDFKAGEVTMKAGDYTVRTPSPGVIRMLSEDGKDAAFLIGAAKRGGMRSQNGVLVFNRYGSQYFLSKVLADAGEGLELIQTRLEREHIAQTKPRSLIVVAARAR
jgi:hypothetical protein